MKSGKHFNASESLDNLPLTHPERFSSPATGGAKSGKKRHRSGAGANEDEEEDDEEDDSSDR